MVKCIANPFAWKKDEPFWNQTQLTSYEQVLDEFQKYDNTAGVFVGNEIMTRRERALHKQT